MQTGFEAAQDRTIGHRLERPSQCRPLVGIVSPHPTNVTLEVPIVDKRGQRLLHRPGGVIISQTLCANDAFSQGSRSYQVTNSQRRCQQFRERPDIGNTTIIIEAGQSR